MNVPVKTPDPVRALPAAYYTDQEVYRRAVERIFLRSWQYVCHESQIPEVGDYYAFSLLDQDLFLTRGRDGKVRGFYNVCQHRGHPLVKDIGRTRVFVCPYHAWSYELDGRLRAAPGSKETAGFDSTKICLTAVQIDSFLGFIFINLDERADSINETFPGVREAVLALCPEIENRRFAHDHSVEELCNWLVAVENYNECYHCSHVHKAFSDGVIDPATYDIQPFGGGRCLHHTAHPAAGEGKWYDTSGSDYGSFYLFPAFSLQVYPGGVVNTYYWRPLTVANTRVHRGWFSPDGIVDDQLQAVIELDRETTFAEDLTLVKNVQRGLSSRGYRPGPLVLSPTCGINSEHSIAALHGWVHEALD